MKPDGIVQLTKSETLLLKATKNGIPKEDIERFRYRFKRDSPEAVLNHYRAVAYAYKNIVSIPNESIAVGNINSFLIDLANKINKSIVQRVMRDLNSLYIMEVVNGKGNYAHPSVYIFRSLYGYLQAVQCRETVDRKLVDLVVYWEDSDDNK